MRDKVKITLNGLNLEVEKGKTILEVCRDNNIYIPALCNQKIIQPFASCRLCLVEIKRNGNSTIETSCSTYVEDNMEIKTDTARVIQGRKTSLELLLSEHYGDCIGPCKKACPLHYDVPTYVGLIADGKMREALKLIKDSTPFAYTLGSICPALCEDECRRQKIEESIAIRLLKKAVAEMDLKSDNPYIPEIEDEKDGRVAVIGGGPSGLTAATQLRRKGYKVTIFETQDKLGGMLRYGIPEFRLPKKMLDREIELALEIGGIDVQYGKKLGKDFSLEELKSKFDAVFIGTGAWVDRTMRIEGEDLPGTYTGIKFLHSIAIVKKIHLGDKVVVIGGGNTAMDVARSAKRLGSDVTILYRRSKKEMPADEIELKQAEEEGIEFRTLTNITKILGKDKVQGVECIKMKLGELDESGRRRPIPIPGSEYKIETDSVVMAIGQYGEVDEMKKFGIECGRSWIKAEEEFQMTNKDGIFAGGDIVLGPSTVVESSAQGKRAALAIDLYLRGKLEKVKKVLSEPWKEIQEIESDPELLNILKEIAPYNHEKEIDEWDLEPYEEKRQLKVKLRAPEERIKDFIPIEGNFTLEEAKEEAKRCMSCGCEAQFECELRKLATIYQADQKKFEGELTRYRPDERHEYIVRDQSKCILCGKCVNQCNEILGEYAIDFARRGFSTVIEPPFEEKLDCINCGACVNSCPTGALEDKKTVEKPGPFKMETISTICGICGLGCPVLLRTYNNRVLRIQTPEFDWNMNVLCERGRYKILRDYKPGFYSWKNGKREISINEILNLLNEKNNVNLILSGDLFTEEAEALAELKEKSGINIFIEEKIEKGDVNLKEIKKSNKIHLDIDLDKYAPLKALVNQSLKNGSCLVKNTDSETLSITHKNGLSRGKSLVIPRRMNSIGISSMPFEVWDGNEGISIFIGEPRGKTFDYVIIPAPYYARGGTITTLLGKAKNLKVAVADPTIPKFPLKELIKRIL